MNFCTLAHAFSALRKEPSRTAMTQLLADVLAQSTANEAQIISYLLLGTLRAPYKGNQFNFAEKSMLKAMAHLLNEELSYFSKRVKTKGDIGDTLIESDWLHKDTGLTVEQVYDSLEKIMAISGTGSQEDKAAAIEKLLSHVDVVAASSIVKIITGTMRLGFSDMTLLDALSWMETGDKSLKKSLENAYNMCADIGLIAFILKDKGIKAVEAHEPTVGIPLRLAAAERADSPREIMDRLGTCVAQPKLDGFRLQIHIDKTGAEPKIWFYSRNLLDMSNMFPDLHEALLAVKAKTLIIEGEAIVYDEATDSFLPFQETVKRRRKHSIEEVAQELPLRLYLFDIVYLNGNPVLEQGHEERRALLLNLFGSYSYSQVRVIEELTCTTVQQLTNYFNEQITHGLEGLVVKRPDASYQPGKRNFNWIKLKRHQEGELTDTIDTVILGYYAGMGKRAAFGIGAFLVGVYNDQKDRYESIAKVGTGLTDAEWIDLKERCDKFVISDKPASVICAPELAPDVWVTPALVTVILADEITQSPLHAAGKTESASGLALRFPRFMGFAVDKKPEQATTVKECRRLFELQFGR